ncbi:MAG: Hsp20/alpha crystallin family protein [Candidatus Aminicenantales bacterium]|jgi:HSP20 family protein
MIRRIKPVSRIRKTETEVRKPSSAAPPPRRSLPGLGELLSPAVDIYEKEGEIVVEMELPGVHEKDVKILLYPGRVEVRGLKREIPSHQGVRYLRLERGFGAFQRDVPVPGAVDPDKAYASFENGILTIVLGKPPRKTRDVDIRNRRNEG